MSDGRRPREVIVGPFRFGVVYDENRCNRDAIDQGAANHNFGLMLPLEQRIFVNPRQGPDMERDTLLHEVMHACLISQGMAAEDEERVVSHLATSLLDVFQRNPDLVEYLCG